MNKNGTRALQLIHDEHVAVATVLRSLQLLIEQGPGDQAERFFDLVRAMLFYIDEFPEQRHHPKESNLLFPKLARLAPDLMPVIRRLEVDHIEGEGRVRELQHQLLGWELLGESRRSGFLKNVQEYAHFYLEHMRVEETDIFPVAELMLQDTDWAELVHAFSSDRDPLAGGVADPAYERLFTRIVMAAPALLGGGGEEAHKAGA